MTMATYKMLYWLSYKWSKKNRWKNDSETIFMTDTFWRKNYNCNWRNFWYWLCFIRKHCL